MHVFVQIKEIHLHKLLAALHRIDRFGSIPLWSCISGSQVNERGMQAEDVYYCRVGAPGFM